MNWTYSDWDQQSGAAAQLARLLLHMQEVRNKIGAEVSGGGMARSSAALERYYATLKSEKADLEAQVSGGAKSGGINVVRIV